MTASAMRAISAPASEHPQSQAFSSAWLHQVFAAMDALRAAGGGTAIVQRTADQYLMSVHPLQLEGGVA